MKYMVLFFIRYCEVFTIGYVFMSISSRLLFLRGKKPRIAFAKLLGVHPQTVYLYEKGKRIPDEEMLNQICNRLKISLDWLKNGVEPKERLEPNPNALIRCTDCPHCAKLEMELERLRNDYRALEEERRVLNHENRILWSEKEALLSKLYTLQLKHCQTTLP